MPETLFFRDDWKGNGFSTAFQAARSGLNEALGVEALTNSTITRLTTFAMGQENDGLATGVAGNCNGTSWTLRWDWDPVKLLHVNTECARNKAAYLEQSRVEYQRRQRTPVGEREPYQQDTFLTIAQTATSDAEWSVELWRANSNNEAYRLECAESLLQHWVARLGWE